MDGFKSFLVHHGEKLLLALILPLCAVSLASSFGHMNPDRLYTSGAPFNVKPFEINRPEIDRVLANVEETLRSARPNRSGDLKPPGSSLAALLDAPPRTLGPAATQWVMYSQPPPVEGVAFTAPPPQVNDPPSQYITKVAPPQNIELQAGNNCVLITAFDPRLGQVTWPLDGQVEVLVQRLAVVEAKDDLSNAILQAVRHVDMNRLPPNLATVSSQNFNIGPARTGDPSAPQADGSTFVRTSPVPSENVWDQFTQSGVNSTGFAGVNDGTGVNTGRLDLGSGGFGPLDINAGMGLRTAFDQDWGIDARVKEHVEFLADVATAIPHGWVTVGAMAPFIRPLTAEQREKALLSGELPEAGRVLPSEPAAAPPPPEPVRETEAPEEASGQTGTATAFMDLPEAPRGGGAAPVPATAMPVLNNEAFLEDAYVPRPRAFLDTGLQPNTLYRYRLVLRAKARDLPESYRQQREYRDYVLRVEWGDVVRRDPGRPAVHPSTSITEDAYLAPSQSAWDRFVSESERVPPIAVWWTSELARRRLASEANPRPFPVLEPVPMEWDRAGRITPLVRQDGILTELANEYRSGRYAYSRPANTYVVLTPMSRRINLSSINPAPGEAPGVWQATFKVDFFEGSSTRSSPAYKMLAPPEAGALTWQRWIKTDERGNWLVGADGKAQLRTLPEFYEDLTLLRPRPIGQAETVRAARGQPEQKIDFYSRWGLVDIRTAQFIKRRTAQDRAGKPQLGPDGQPRISVSTEDVRYAVIREMDAEEGQTPRYRRILGKKIVPREGEQIMVEWEPVLRGQLDDFYQKQAEEDARTRAAAELNQRALDPSAPLPAEDPDIPLTPDFDDGYDASPAPYLDLDPDSGDDWDYPDDPD